MPESVFGVALGHVVVWGFAWLVASVFAGVPVWRWLGRRDRPSCAFCGRPLPADSLAVISGDKAEIRWFCSEEHANAASGAGVKLRYSAAVMPR